MNRIEYNNSKIHKLYLIIVDSYLQLALQCTVSSEGSVSTTGEVIEVILDRGITVSECCAAMAMATGLTGGLTRYTCTLTILGQSWGRMDYF